MVNAHGGLDGHDDSDCCLVLLRSEDIHPGNNAHRAEAVKNTHLFATGLNARVWLFMTVRISHAQLRFLTRNPVYSRHGTLTFSSASVHVPSFNDCDPVVQPLVSCYTCRRSHAALDVEVHSMNRTLAVGTLACFCVALLVVQDGTRRTSRRSGWTVAGRPLKEQPIK